MKNAVSGIKAGTAFFADEVYLSTYKYIVKKLEQDEVFAQQLLDSQDVETVQQICAESSITLTQSEAERTIRKTM